jgi:hypothetical protein
MGEGEGEGAYFFVEHYGPSLKAGKARSSKIFRRMRTLALEAIVR